MPLANFSKLSKNLNLNPVSVFKDVSYKEYFIANHPFFSFNMFNVA